MKFLKEVVTISILIQVATGCGIPIKTGSSGIMALITSPSGQFTTIENLGMLKTYGPGSPAPLTEVNILEETPGSPETINMAVFASPDLLYFIFDKTLYSYDIATKTRTNLCPLEYKFSATEDAEYIENFSILYMPGTTPRILINYIATFKSTVLFINVNTCNLDYKHHSSDLRIIGDPSFMVSDNSAAGEQRAYWINYNAAL